MTMSTKDFIDENFLKIEFLQINLNGRFRFRWRN